MSKVDKVTNLNLFDAFCPCLWLVVILACYSSLYSLSQPCDRLLDVTLLLLWFVIPGSHLYIEDPALASFLGTSFLAAFLSWLPQQISPLSKTLFTHGPCLHEILMRQEPRFPSSSGYKRKLDTEAAAGYWTRAFQHGKQVSQSWCWTLCYFAITTIFIMIADPEIKLWTVLLAPKSTNPIQGYGERKCKNPSSGHTTVIPSTQPLCSRLETQAC